MASSASLVLLMVVTINILLTPTETAAPVFVNLPPAIYVGESETGARLLSVLSIYDPNGNSFTCSLTIAGELSGVAVADNDNEFQLKWNTNDQNYELWTNSATFDDTVINKYVTSIACTDTNGETSTGNNDIEINIVPSGLLTVNNVDGASNALTVNALSTGQGTTLKTVSATSSNGNPVQFNLVSDPSFTPEFFTIVNGTGQIKANRDLQYLDSKDPTVYLTIEAYDTIDQIKVYSTQIVHLTNQNTVPATTNMITPLRETKIETLAAGDILFTVSVEDPDSSQAHSFRYTCSPVAGEDTFELDANGNFKIAANMEMDYESIPFFNCSFYIDDGIEEGGPFVYELTVANDNEAPVFSDVMYYVSTLEGSKGSVSFDPGVTCTDVDSGDSTTYDFQAVNNSDRFAIDSSGIMTFDTDYDVDNSAMPTEVILTIYCIDSGHIDGVKKTGSAQVTITINDRNDNDPVFSSSAYTITVDQTVSPGSAIGTITPTDDDSGTNADLTCSSISSSSYSTYYTVGADCNVYLSKTIDFAYGTHVGYTASAKDDGSPQRTGTTAIDIIYEELVTTTTTTTTTTTAYNFFDHPENIALFVLSLLMGLALLGLLTWCCLRLCCSGACGGRGMCDCVSHGRSKKFRHQRRAITPEQESPRPRTKIREEIPRKIYQEQRPVQVIRSMGRSPYANFRPMPYPMQQVPSLPPGYYP